MIEGGKCGLDAFCYVLSQVCVLNYWLPSLSLEELKEALVQLECQLLMLDSTNVPSNTLLNMQYTQAECQALGRCFQSSG